MTDERLMQILKEELYSQFDSVGGLDCYIVAMKRACNEATKEAVEKGSIGFVKFLAEEFSDERNDEQNPLSELPDGVNMVYYYKGGSSWLSYPINRTTLQRIPKDH